uniref:KLTH0D14102p n=1 Tax=Haemonchus contortus TaxID=6289 RepID=W6NWC3_HAECO
MEDAASTDTTVKAEPTIKPKKTAPKTMRSEKSKPATKTSDTESSQLSLELSRKRPTTSSFSSDDLPPKKNRASGTFLKELLQQGSKILCLAASKVDQLAPAVSVSSSSETMERLQELEQIIKGFHEQNRKMHKSNEAKIDKADLKINLLTARFSKIEERFKDHTGEENSDEQRKRDHNWNELRDEVKQMREQVSAINLTQLSDDIKGLYERFDELSLRLNTPRTATPAEPSPELERILRQMSETEKELHDVRKETSEINLLIEKTWQKDRSTEAIDRLKVKRRRLQSKESRLEEEMRDLESRLEREKSGEYRDRRRREGRGRDSASSYHTRDNSPTTPRPGV